MSATKNHSLAGLLARIEDLAGLDPAALPAAELAVKVAERQETLDQVECLDPTRLTRAERASLQRHLQALSASTTAFATALRARMAQLSRSRAQLLSARNAMRGYRPAMTRKSRTVNRAV